jgi:hypothetical protein
MHIQTAVNHNISGTNVKPPPVTRFLIAPRKNGHACFPMHVTQRQLATRAAFATQSYLELLRPIPDIGPIERDSCPGVSGVVAIEFCFGVWGCR